jgi:sugar/nucleoside kinase (ribokinase family)
LPFHQGVKGYNNPVIDYRFDIIGVGSPIMDILARVEESFLARVGGAKGGMELVDAQTLDSWLAALPEPPSQVPGGSASNTVAAMARLGVRATFLGKLGGDATAEAYTREFARIGGDTSRFKRGSGPNARCLSLVTPDSQRTMRTDLGAAMTLDPAEITPEDFVGCRHAHIEGYLLFNRPLLRRVLDCAHQAGCTVSLDLASFEVVQAARDILPTILEKNIDVVFANEDEADAYFGEPGDHADQARRLGSLCQVAAVKVGKKGAFVAAEGRVHEIAPLWVDQPVDTTGAGDLWAAGFLTGWLRGHDIPQSGRYGAILGAEIVQVLGASIPEHRWPSVLKHF